jgi:YbbR domain-containing protein
MILALLLAFAVWIVAILQVDPFVDEVFTGVPLARSGQAESTILFEPVSEQVSVEVRAPDSVVRELTVSDFEATMDLSRVQPGVPTPVTVHVTCNNETVRIQSIDPVEEIVHLEEVRTITLPIALEVTGEAATGYRAARPQLTPDHVSIFGPVPYLSQVLSVTASVDIDGVKEDVLEQVVVTPRDASGRLVAGVQWAPDLAEVEIRVDRRVGYKPDVEVVPDLQVTPAPGYRLGSVSADPSVVTLKGPPSVLDGLPGFVETLPISVSDVTEDLSSHTPLTVPANVVVVGVNLVTVTVEVLPIQSSRTMTAVVEVQGAPQGWIATPSPGMVDVILEGPDAVLAELEPDDIQILLNLYGYPLGVHRVQPIVLAPEDVTAVSVIPETIEVVIEAPREPLVPTDTLRIEESLP